MNNTVKAILRATESRNVLRAAGNYFIRNSISFKSFF